MARTVKDAAEELQKNPKFVEALRESGILVAGQRPSVSFRGPKNRKRQSADFDSNWRPTTDSITIEFESVSEKSSEFAERPAETKSAKDPVADIIAALDRAESRGLDFVALKWFRDVSLVGEGLSWAKDDALRQSALSEAIERRLVLTHKVPNPKAPQFPVTAIRLNRLAPEVVSIVGGGKKKSFHEPIKMRGEPLSATVLHGRR